MKQGYKLPIGIQVFRDLREEDYIYVDKTEFAYRPDIKQENIVPIAYQLKRAFLNNDLPAAMDLVNSIFAGIPHSIFDGSSEAYFHSLVHVIFSFFGSYMESEVNTNRSVILAPDRVFILEFKMSSSAQAALDQIKTKGYAQKYRPLGKPIVGVGINFESGKREIGE